MQVQVVLTVTRENQETWDRKAPRGFQAVPVEEAALVNQAALDTQAPQAQRDPQETEAPQDLKAAQAGREKKGFADPRVLRANAARRATKDVRVPLGKPVPLDYLDPEDLWVNQELAVPLVVQDPTAPQDPRVRWARRANQDCRVKREPPGLRVRPVNRESKDPTGRKDPQVLTDRQEHQALTARWVRVVQMDLVAPRALMDAWDLVASVVDQDHPAHQANPVLSVRKASRLSATAVTEVVEEVTSRMRTSMLHMKRTSHSI